MGNLFYNSKDIMLMVGCCQSKAYKLIKNFNKKLIKDKIIDKDLIIKGKVLKTEWDRVYKIAS